MRYLIDIHHGPALVILATEDAEEAERVGQQYANQTGRPVLELTGAPPAKAQYRPVIPTVEQAQQTLPVVVSV